MQNELNDADVVRLIAYVTPVQLSEFDDDEEGLIEEIKNIDANAASDEYLIDFLTIKEAKEIGSKGMLSKVAEVLTVKNIIKQDEKKLVTWRLVRDGDLTPNEQSVKTSNDELKNSYQVTDLRHLH